MSSNPVPAKGYPALWGFSVDKTPQCLYTYPYKLLREAETILEDSGYPPKKKQVAPGQSLQLGASSAKVKKRVLIFKKDMVRLRSPFLSRIEGIN
jgi:hypothetical protein